MSGAFRISVTKTEVVSTQYVCCCIFTLAPWRYYKTKHFFFSLCMISIRMLFHCRCIPYSLLYYVGSGRSATVLHGTGARSIPSIRLLDYLEENLSGPERYVMFFHK